MADSGKPEVEKIRKSTMGKRLMTSDLPSNSMESVSPQHIAEYRLEDFCKKRRMSSGSSAAAAEVVSPNLQSAGEPKRFGWISVIGRRRAMEDAVKVAEFGVYQFFAVYDGHGGSAVANACRERLHCLLEEEVDDRICSRVDWEKTMADCFRKMDDEVAAASGGSGSESESDSTEITVGSTAVVVVVGRALVVVANCGDSRAVLCRDGKAVPLSRDHKPDRPDEKERVEAAGGRIVNWNGYRVLGVLATSRSIGDHYLKPYVISEPEVTVWDRTDSDSFLIIASDGLWDVVSNEFACELVRRCFDGQIRGRISDGMTRGSAAEAAAALLAELALARGSKDNISVVVVDLNK